MSYQDSDSYYQRDDSNFDLGDALEPIADALEPIAEVAGAFLAGYMNANNNIRNNQIQQNPQFQQNQLSQQYIVELSQSWLNNPNLPVVNEFIRRYVQNQSIQDINIMNNTLMKFNNPAFFQKRNYLFGCINHWRTCYKKW